jgi:hypothetical protein
VILVGEHPGGGDRRVEHKSHSAAVSFVACRQQLCNGDLADPLTQRAEAGDRLVYLGLPALRLGYEAGDRPPVTGDDDSFAALDLVEDLRQVRLCLGGLDFSHIWRQFGWSF